MSRYADRPRDTEYMLWIKGQRCCAKDPALPWTHVGPCDGPVEADHAGGGSGMGRKADDSTCIPLCVRHHREPGLEALLYGHVNHGEVRRWKREQAMLYRERYDARKRLELDTNGHVDCDCISCRPWTS